MNWQKAVGLGGVALVVAGVFPAYAQRDGIERSLAGIRINASSKEILRVFGNPNDIQIGDVSVRPPAASGAQQGGGSFGGGMGDEGGGMGRGMGGPSGMSSMGMGGPSGMSSMGMGGPSGMSSMGMGGGGKMGAMGGGPSGMSSMGMGGPSGMSMGGPSGMQGMGMGGPGGMSMGRGMGGPSGMQGMGMGGPGGMSMGRGMGSGAGKMGGGGDDGGMPGSAGGPNMGAGAGAGIGAFGQTVSSSTFQQEVTWSYSLKALDAKKQKQAIGYDFLISPEGKVSQIRITGYVPRSAKDKSSKGLTLGSTYKDLIRTYGTPKSVMKSGELLVCSYPKQHIEFQLMNMKFVNGYPDPYNGIYKIVAIQINGTE